MSVLKLQLSVAGTLVFLIALSALFFTVILNLRGITARAMQQAPRSLRTNHEKSEALARLSHLPAE